MNNQNYSDPVAAALSAVFNPANGVIDGVLHLLRGFDQLEKERRYDDNKAKLLNQALRLYEQGQLSKSQLMAIVQMLPETIEVEAEQKPIENNSNIDIKSILEVFLSK
jgi:hypothetical protein